VTASPVLVTAFEPFGLVRGHVPGLRGNRSETLLDALRATMGSAADVTFERLPVSAECEGRLERRLREGPRGVLLMGEDLLSGMRLEQKARDPSHQIGFVGLPGASVRTSTFAQAIAPDMQRRGVSTWSGIGTYYCNRAYWQALGWAGDVPQRRVVFFHVGPLASVDWQLATIQEVLARMRAA
jgi:pyrrolidone-carboxylate peptidase